MADRGTYVIFRATPSEKAALAKRAANNYRTVAAEIRAVLQLAPPSRKARPLVTSTTLRSVAVRDDAN